LNPPAEINENICLGCSYSDDGGTTTVGAMSEPFVLSVSCLMTAPSGWSGATTTYTKSITDASTTSNEAFNFGGEFTTSDAAGCPFDGLFHASDGTTVPPVNPSIFTATTSTYVSGTTTYDSAYTLTPGVHTFFLMA